MPNSRGQVQLHAKDCHGSWNAADPHRWRKASAVLLPHFPCALLPSSGSQTYFLYICVPYILFNLFLLRIVNTAQGSPWWEAESLQRPLLETMTEILLFISATIPSSVHCRSETAGKQVLSDIWNKTGVYFWNFIHMSTLKEPKSFNRKWSLGIGA